MNDMIDFPDYTTEELATLSPIELTAILIEHEDRAPFNAIQECAQRNEAMTTHLHSLHDCGYLWQYDAGSGLWWLRLHAVMILGLIPSEQAGLLLVQLMRRMSQEGDDNLQDWIAGYWPALFRNKPESVHPVLRDLCEDSSLDWYIRANAIKAALELAAQQSNAALEPALAWLAGIAANEQENWTLRLSTANELLDYPRAEYRPLLEGLAARQTGFGRHFTLDNVEQAYAGPTLSGKLDRFKNPWRFYEPEEIAKRQRRWQEEDARGDLQDSFDEEDYPDWSYQEPYVRAEPKTGRNDPCPCGSGKKYKKCCLNKE